MQQLALQQPIYHQPGHMKAMVRDARDPNHATGSDGFHLASAKNDKTASIKAHHSDHYAGIKPLEKSASSTPSSGDIIEPALSIASGAIMGGPIGALTAAAGEVFEMISGDSIIGHVAGLFTDTAPAATTLAKANRAYLQAGTLVSSPR